MKVNVNRLRGKMVENNVSGHDLAASIGINENTFYRKLKADGLAFTIGQMHGIVDTLHLSKDEAIAIFLE